MKHVNAFPLLAAHFLMLIAIGCQPSGNAYRDGSTDPPVGAAKPSPQEQIAQFVTSLRNVPEESRAIASDQAYVRLYLPKMFWTKCEALVQGDLKKNEAFQNIHTVLKLQTVSFVIPSGFDYRATIDELIVPNPLFEDYAVVDEIMESGTEDDRGSDESSVDESTNVQSRIDLGNDEGTGK